MKHTPGPWTVNGHAIEQDTEENAICVGFVEYEENPNWQADVRLMASAPDLYSALSDLLSANTPALYMAAWDHAVLALARTRGEEET